VIVSFGFRFDLIFVGFSVRRDEDGDPNIYRWIPPLPLIGWMRSITYIVNVAYML